MYKRLAPVLWLCTAPLFAQNGQQPSMQMPGMATEKPSLMPVPSLLQGVASRTPLKLEDFLAMAERNNPTLQQAAAIIRHSEAEATQAGLYPNPTVGYEGDQIRGGSYGGGEQGGFVAQTIGSLGFAATFTHSKNTPTKLPPRHSFRG
jgi:outer membrane protein TolC